MRDPSESSLGRLFALPAFSTSGKVALKPGFDRIQALLAGMGHPEADRETVLVAGTNGKGSTASMIAALSTSAGVRTGLHTSPHLIHVGERMRVDGQPAPTEWLATQMERWGRLFDTVEPSFFEATLALSCCWFAEHDARRWVVEVGLGGRLDATNALGPSISVITSIGWDHEALLGPTLADIAREKAGIARPGRPLVIGEVPNEALEAIRNVAAATGSLLIQPTRADAALRGDDGSWTLNGMHRKLPRVELPLAGRHQANNALLALEVMERLHADDPVSDDCLRDGFSRLREWSGLRARQEWVTPWCMVDVAHNPEALATTLDAFGKAPGVGPDRVVILGFLEDKDVEAAGALLTETWPDGGLLAKRPAVKTVPIFGARGLTARETADRLASGGWTGPVETTTVEAALAAAGEGNQTLLVAGSHHVAAAALSWLGQNA